MDLWELCLLPTCPTSNTQSRALLGAFSVSLCHWVGCASAEGPEPIQSTQGTLLEYVQPLQSLEWGFKLMLPAAVNVTLLAGEGGGPGMGGDA